MNMDKIWHRGVTKYLQNKGLTPKDTHADKDATLGDDAPALSTVQKWAAEFKRGRESLEDDPRSGHTIGISLEHIENIQHKELDMLKVSVRWVPRLLTPDQKHTRLVM